jgi:hypothetical protein
MATPMKRRYASASARSTSAIDSTVASTERWKRTRRPSAMTAIENGSISWYSSPAPARSSSAGMSVMLMMLWATECRSKRYPGIVSAVREPPPGRSSASSTTTSRLARAR